MSTVRKTKNKTDWIQDIQFNQLPKIKQVAFVRDEMAFVLDDDRIIYIPIEWSKKLRKATVLQRNQYTTNGYHVFWDDIDEVIGVKNVLFGKELFV